jgi:hypothetical protein
MMGWFFLGFVVGYLCHFVWTLIGHPCLVAILEAKVRGEK